MVDLRFKSSGGSPSQPPNQVGLNFGNIIDQVVGSIIIVVPKPVMTVNAVAEIDKDKNATISVIVARPQMTVISSFYIPEDNTNRCTNLGMWQTAILQNLTSVNDWQIADNIGADLIEPVLQSEQLRNEFNNNTGNAIGMDVNSADAYSLSDSIEQITFDRQELAEVCDVIVNEICEISDPVPSQNVSNRWEECVHLTQKWTVKYDESESEATHINVNHCEADQHLTSNVIKWEEAEPIPKGVRVTPEPPIIPPYVPSTDMDFTCRLASKQHDTKIILNFGFSLSCPWDGVYVPQRGVYVIMNELSLVTVNGQELNPFNVTISTDEDSWCWEFNASIPKYELALVNPETDPVEVVLTINGIEWSVLVESYTIGEQFNQSIVNIRGRSITAGLSSSYSPNMSYRNDVATTARQVFDQILAMAYPNNEITGEWGIIDELGWNIPSGGFSWSNSAPLYILSKLVSVADGFLYSDPFNPKIHALPKYPTASWHWPTNSPSKIINKDFMRTARFQWDNKPVYNGVYLSGDSKDGIDAFVKITGTDGSLLASPVFDPMLTDSLVARQRGMSVLSSSGKQAVLGVDMPFDSSLGIIRPRTLLRIEDGENWNGMSKSISIRASVENRALVITQSIDIEKHYWG